MDGIDPIFAMDAIRDASAAPDARAASDASNASKTVNTQAAQKTGAAYSQKETDAYLQQLAQKYPAVRFSAGGGFSETAVRQLAKQGGGHVMFEPGTLGEMTQVPETARRLEDSLDKLLSGFERMFGGMAELEESLASWGVFVSGSGLFSTWGMFDPFNADSRSFEFFDATVARNLYKFEQKEYEQVLNAEKQVLEYEQGLEKAEEALHKTQELNPHIQNKQQAEQAAEQYRQGMGHASAAEEGRILDLKD